MDAGLGALAEREIDAEDLGSGRIAGSEIKTPTIFVNLV